MTTQRKSPLIDYYSENAATMSVQYDMSVAASFGDSAREYEAIRTGAAVFDLPWYETLEFTGDDRVEYLHNMLSNDVKKLADGEGCRSSILTAQGKIVGIAAVMARDDRIVLLVEGARGDAVAAHLDMYVIADDVEIEASGMAVIGITGPNAHAVLTKLELPVPEERYWHEHSDGITVLRMELTGEPTWALIAAPNVIPPLWARLIDAGAVPVGYDAVNTARIEVGASAYGFEATDERFPLEVGLDDTISTEKGCYLGQETIIRILHRGHVNRALCGLAITGDVVPSVPVNVYSGVQNIGTLTSATVSPRTGRVIGLAILRVRKIEVGATVVIKTADEQLEATIVELPFLNTD